MPDELIVLYTKEAPNTPLSAGRTAYYDHALDTYSTHYPCVVDVLLFNSQGELLLQKRARTKRFNPGKLHTTVGGHINVGEHHDFTMVHECMEELGAPLLLFPKETFPDAYSKLHAYATRAAFGYFVDERFRDFRTDSKFAQTAIKDRSYFYLGLYDGPFGSPDRDSAGYEWMSLETFGDQMKNHPDQFTNGIALFVDVYKKEIEEFVALYCNKK